jgi:hypothetical protein
MEQLALYEWTVKIIESLGCINVVIGMCTLLVGPCARSDFNFDFLLKYEQWWRGYITN